MATGRWPPRRAAASRVRRGSRPASASRGAARLARDRRRSSGRADHRCTARARSRSTRRSGGSGQSADRTSLRARERDAADLLRRSRSPWLQGRAVQHRRRGPVHRRHGGRRRGPALAFDFLPARSCCRSWCCAAMLGGVAWAAVPAILKVKTGAHEVVTTIMMNGIAVEPGRVGVNFRSASRTPGRPIVDLRTDSSPSGPGPRHRRRASGSRPGAHLSWLLFLAIGAAVGVWFLLRRMRLGYEARAVGSSPGSARGRRRLDRRDPDQDVPDLRGARRVGRDERSSPTAGICARTTDATSGSPGSRWRSWRKQPDRDHLRGDPMGDPARGGGRAADRDRRPARVHHHPPGRPDPLGRHRLRDREAASGGAALQRARAAGEPAAGGPARARDAGSGGTGAEAFEPATRGI